MTGKDLQSTTTRQLFQGIGQFLVAHGHEPSKANGFSTSRLKHAFEVGT